MTDTPERLSSAGPEDLIEAFAFALRSEDLGKDTRLSILYNAPASR
jgi:hypothetical protein